MTDEVQAAASRTRPQFGLAALLWTIAVVALGLAFLRRFNTPVVFIEGAACIMAAALLGLLLGWGAKRAADATYWSVVIATAAFLSVAGEHAYGSAFRFAWSLVGALAGACAGAIPRGRLLLRMLAGALAAGGIMVACSVLPLDRRADWTFDLLCAPIVGALVGVLIELLLWLESERYSPRYVTASWLLLAVIIGNFMVPLVT